MPQLLDAPILFVGFVVLVWVVSRILPVRESDQRPNRDW
jgi:hypothetical protein